jgi:hypothetical protein
MSLVRNLYLDESGSTEVLETTASQDFYVLCCLIIDSEKIEIARDAARQIVSKHAGNGELKSSNIGSNLERRARILADVADRFPFYALSVDKERIWKDSGLRFRPVFYKFLHRMVYNRLKKTFTQIDIVADQYGNTDFMQSFRDYIEEKTNIFEKFEFAKACDVPLLQIADVIGGTIRRAFQGEDSPEILRQILSNDSLLETWPPEATPTFVEHGRATSECDEPIRIIALNNARKYVEEHLTSEEVVDQLKAEGIRYLLYKYYEDPEQYVYRDEIVGHLNSVTREPVGKQFLSTEILGDARDEHVIIVSTDNGMKLPNCADDLYKWTQRAQSQIMPYLRRLEDARNNILLASSFDIVPEGRFSELNSVLEKRRNVIPDDSKRILL